MTSASHHLLGENPTDTSGMDAFRHGLAGKLASHETSIKSLDGRMSGVESGLNGLKGEVHSLGSKIDSGFSKLDAAPKVDVHRTVATILHLSVLFSMVVGGIIWVTTAQIATMSEKVKDHDSAITKLAERMGWVARVEPQKGGR